MIKVGFFSPAYRDWLGGINYFKNLLYAISEFQKEEIQPIIFIGKKTEKEIKEIYKKYAHVEEVSFLDRYSLNWFLWKSLKKITGSDIFIEFYLKNFKMDVISHADVRNLRKIKTVNWIPDFQHIHLPKMFSPKELKERDRFFYKIAKGSDLVILSSFAALKDFEKFAFPYRKKARVLQFVAQPSRTLLISNSEHENEVLKKYNISEPFFYLPNHFWKHKNHLIVFEALSFLKDSGQNFSLICSGHLDDYRNKDHIKELNEFILKKDIRVKLLGVIDYDDVIVLMKKSIAVINPSLFEGWSSTVEECKSLGKSMILSDIPVHREQNPPQSKFFKPFDYIQLGKAILQHATMEKISQLDSAQEENLKRLQNRTLEFSEKYYQIIQEVISS